MRHDPPKAAADAYLFEITGGNLALDFANTISRGSVVVADREHLTGYGRLVSWAEQAGALTDEEARRLRVEGEERPAAAAAALRRAIAAREAIFSLFSAAARDEPAPPEALAALNGTLPGALASLRVSLDQDGFRWTWKPSERDLASMLHPVVRAAADLLISQDLERVRECDAETCAWLFLDRSKNATRRWCDMSVCGNRAKARRHYQRAKRQAGRGRGQGKTHGDEGR